MQLPICALVTWLSIILFTLTPKRLSAWDCFFLYCVVLSITATSYTFFELNWHSVTIPRNGTSMTAAAISRLIAVPVLIMIAVNALQTHQGRKPMWHVSSIIWICLSLFDWALSRYNVISYNYSLAWHAVSTPLTYLGFIAVAWTIMWGYQRLDRGIVKQS